MEQGEDRLLGLEDWVEELEHSDKDKEKSIRKYNGACKTSGAPLKDESLWNMGKEGEEVQN
jgi:hypothetical protein